MIRDDRGQLGVRFRPVHSGSRSIISSFARTSYRLAEQTRARYWTVSMLGCGERTFALEGSIFR